MKVLNLFGKSMVSIVAVMAACVANAAQNGRVGMMSAATTARMPTIPVVGLTTIGNPAVTTVNQPAEANLVPTPIPDPKPDPDPDPKPVPGCPDGGVENSTYTVTNCMNDVLQCINTGALQGGLNDLFNEDVRNAIMSGMKLCQVHVDKCIKEVRVNCHNVYQSSADVWLDFDSRIIQPEYYNFVLRKTGLTPNQAENTCLLLDRNTYGSSFAAVSDTNEVNTEYKNKVGAYNSVGGSDLSKDNPQGVAVNTVGYDGNRGHYARWDATKAECLIRVAAYNKDKLITNNWLFGAAGDDTPAEVWQKAGSTFTCNKGLFDMDSLLNDTRTAAVVGVVGGTVVGTAIGAAAGAGAYNKKHNAYENALNVRNEGCDNEDYVQRLGQAIKSSDKKYVLETYAYNDALYDTNTNKFTGTKVFDFSKDFDKDQCEAINNIQAKVELYKSAISKCNTSTNRIISQTVTEKAGGAGIKSVTYLSTGKMTIDLTTGGPVECNLPAGVEGNDIQQFNNCLFVPLQLGLVLQTTDNPLCNHDGYCMTVEEIQKQISEIEGIIKDLRKAGFGEMPEDANKGKEIGKGAAIGGATGAATGAIITGITALVEKDHISCKVGDGLNSVSLGKSLTIDSLKDFYVKWNLRLPDTVSPTSAVIDKVSWEQACSQFNGKLADCPKVQINLKDTNGKYTLIPSACKVSGTICIVNDSVATSHGVK